MILTMFRVISYSPMIQPRGVSAGDVVVGVSVAGGAAYVVGGLQRAKELGASTIALTCNDNSPIAAAWQTCYTVRV